MAALPLLLKAWVPGAVAAVALLSTCEVPPTGPATGLAADATREGEQRLQGTWLREYAVPGAQVRRVLALEPDGAFRETVRVVEDGGRVTSLAHAGTWLYDGTNLKRKYTLMNGSPPSRLNVPFVTLQVSFESRNEFLGVDHVRGHKVRYRRVAPETQP